MPNFNILVAGQFVKHPGGEINYTVNITDPNNSITKGIPDFSIFSKQYYMHVDPTLNILASTQFSRNHDYWIEGVKVHVAWTKKWERKCILFFFGSFSRCV